ncbi:MAG: Ig-like domain-containing protein [Fibrobacter sp.]|nr:Ig-like domain-containing protein [Fibrobacter sp.]
MKFLPLVYAFAIMAMLLSCATQVAPGGGPEDKLPPRVAAVYPAPNTTNHPNELYVKLEFDEWINASVPRSAVSISPPIDKKMKFEVSGKTLVLTSRAELDTGTTYTVTFAGGIKDLHGNMLATPFQIVFSTGAKIDSLKLVGRVLVHDSLVRKKVYPSIGLFLMGSERESRHYLDKYRDTATHVLDSLPMLAKEPPLFLTRTDSVGNFVLSGLRPGRYRVVAFLDANGNQKIEASSELVGIWTGDLSLDSATADTLWVPLADQDTTRLELSTLSQPGASVLEATFTRPVYFDSTFADTSNCKLVAPDKSEFYPSYVYLGATTNKPRFYFSQKPKPETSYKFICANAKDSLFRPLDTLRNELDWEWQEMKGDTMPPSISKTAMLGKAKAAFPDDSLVFAYDKPILDSLKETYYVSINKDTTQVQVKRLDPIRYLVLNEKPWPTDVNVDFLQGYQDTTLAAADSNGVRDTVIELKYRRLLRFETVSKLKLAMLRGKIPGAKGGAKVRLYSIDAKTYSYAVCGTDGSFAFNDIVEGNYFIDYYYAEEGKLTPDGGSLFPFRYGKPWRAPNDTIKVKNGENVLNDLVASPLPALP